MFSLCYSPLLLFGRIGLIFCCISFTTPSSPHLNSCRPFFPFIDPIFYFLIFKMFKFILHFFILIFFYLNSVENSDEVNEYLVESKYGTIRGFPLAIGEDEEINVKVFLGIPYAKAPINELRFEKPLPPKRWNGVRNATEMGPACFPFIRKGMWVPEKEHSEDCLHLNILAPNWQPVDGKPFPVLVYVHGGGFQEGTNRELWPEVLARKYIQEGIIFVTFQYRIGQLGFAATGDEKFAGNYGLWDQKLALEFVRENIDKFGGDPKRVTIWGFSAGSASVSALSISHQTRDLFSQVIQMSGSILGEWAASNRPIGETEKMAKKLGCGELLADSAKLKKCLKGKSVHELMDAVERMGSKRRDLSELLFTPRLDADFFSNEPMHLIHESPPKRTMIGMTKLECIAFTMFGSDSDTSGALFVSTEKRANFGRKNIEEFVKEIVAPEKAFGKEEAKKVQKKIVEFYLAEKGEGVEFYLRKYNELLSDLLFLVPILKEAKTKTLDGWPIYLYQIDYFNRKYFPKNIPLKDSFHSIELPALFDIRYIPYLIEEYSDEDLAFAKVLIGSINNFVKNGDPSMASFKWPKLSADRPLQYAQLNPNPKIMSSLSPEKFKFWQHIEKDYSFDIIRGIHKITLQSKDEL